LWHGVTGTERHVPRRADLAIDCSVQGVDAPSSLQGGRSLETKESPNGWDSARNPRARRARCHRWAGVHVGQRARAGWQGRGNRRDSCPL